MRAREAGKDSEEKGLGLHTDGQLKRLKWKRNRDGEFENGTGGEKKLVYQRK